MHGLTFRSFNKSNSLEVKGVLNIFPSMGKVNGFKLKAKKWENSVAKVCFFSDFEVFDNYMKECGWEHCLHETVKALDVRTYEVIVKHLDLLQKNLGFYFTGSENECLTSNMWVLNPFSNDGTNYSDALLELKVDYYRKAAFQIFPRPIGSQLHVPEYREPAEQATSMFVQMPTSCLCEQDFSSLVSIKTKKMNAILNLDSLMRIAMKNRLKP